MLNSQITDRTGSVARLFFARVGKCSLFAILASAAVVKVALLFAVGPSIQPDSPAYISYADSILSGAAFHPFDFNHSGALPELAFRMAGYPLLIAGSKLLSALYWPDLLVLIQGLATLLTVAVVFVVIRCAFHTKWIPCLVAILYLFSESLLWDNAIVSDSLYSSFFTIVIFMLLGDFVGSWRLSQLSVFGLGGVWGLSLLFRDSGTYFTILPLLLLFMNALRNKSGGWNIALLLASFLLPVCCIVASYVAFNWYRTGVAFFGITGVANWLRPVFDMAALHYAQPFQGHDIVSEAMSGRPSVYDFPAQVQFLNALQERCDCDPVKLQAIVFHKYLATIHAHPFAYLAVVCHNFNFLGLGSLLADPIFTLNQFLELGTRVGRRIIPGLSMRQLAELRTNFSIGELLAMLVATISTTISTVLFISFVLGVPWLAFRTWRKRTVANSELIVACFAWVGFMGFSIAFSMVHYEARHALPILCLGMMGIGYAIERYMPSAYKLLIRWPHRLHRSSVT